MNIDHYKARAAKDPRFAPRFHAGIGMIQVMLTSKNDRLHIWHPEQPITRPDSDMHNHKFSFSSLVLKGMLLHEVVIPVKGDGYNLWTTFQDAGAEAQLAGTVNVQPAGKMYVSPNQEYIFEAGRFHRSEVMGLTITRMQKLWENPAQVVQVIAKKGVKMDHAFANSLPRPPEARLWELIEDATWDLEVA